MTDPDWCEECRYYKGHDITCSRMAAEEAIGRLRAAVVSHRETHDAHRKSAARLKELITLWQGKYHIVKAENNKLRQRVLYLEQLTKEPDTK